MSDPIQVDDLALTTLDGTRLAARLWRPSGAGPWPVLLMRQPYGRAIASTVTYAHPHWYASQGYAVLVQDVRGRGASEGAFGGFSQEAADGTATLNWLRRQPWCNGRVGCYGFSYQGLTQLLWRDPAQLPDAIAPAMTGLDERLDWASEGGAHGWALGLGWGLQLAAQACRRRGDAEGWRRIRISLESGGMLQEGLALLEALDPQNMVLAWLQGDPADPVGWRRHQPPAALWQRPMLLIGGWHDPHLNGVLRLWQRARATGANPLLRIGAWSHLRWNGGIDRLQLRFFDQQLRTPPTDPGHPAAEPAAQAPGEPPLLLQDLVGGAWLERSPLMASEQCWELHSHGLAAVDADEGRLLPPDGGGAGVVLLVHDPWRPLPGRGGHLGLDAGAAERADLDARCDVACFSSAPLDREQELLGRPVVQLIASADQPGFDLCVALSRVRADGSVQQLSTGVARWLGDDCRRPQRRTVQLQPLLARLPAGERLRLSIGLAAWPQIAVNPGNGETPRGPAGPEHREITVQLELGGATLCITAMVGAN